MKDKQPQLGLLCVSEAYNNNNKPKQVSATSKLKAFLPATVVARLELKNKIIEEKDPRKREGLIEAAKLYERAFDLL
jgi:hypothetical protein